MCQLCDVNSGVRVVLPVVFLDVLYGPCGERILFLLARTQTHTHTHTYTYTICVCGVYVYICVCVCVCLCVWRNFPKKQNCLIVPPSWGQYWPTQIESGFGLYKRLRPYSGSKSGRNEHGYFLWSSETGSAPYLRPIFHIQYHVCAALHPKAPHTVHREKKKKMVLRSWSGCSYGGGSSGTYTPSPFMIWCIKTLSKVYGVCIRWVLGSVGVRHKVHLSRKSGQAHMHGCHIVIWVTSEAWKWHPDALSFGNRPRKWAAERRTAVKSLCFSGRNRPMFGG
jgi:hypothetical protein